MAEGNQATHEQSKEFDPKMHREKWLKRLVSEIEKIKPIVPVKFLDEKEEHPQWVVNVEREFSIALLTAAKLRDPKYEITPKRMGALIGHACEMAVWLVDWFDDAVNKQDEKKLPSFTQEELERGQQFLESFVSWYNTVRRLAKLALCSSVDQSYEDMRDFLLGYADGFARKPRKFGFGDIGTTTTEIYHVMLIYWKTIEQLGSVRQFHEWLVTIFGKQRVGDQKRVEKLCQRIGLSFRKAGRPKQK